MTVIAAHRGLVRADLARDVVIVQGDDAASFLHSQLAQDILSVTVGSSAHSLLLQPDGHVVSLVRVTRHADTVFTIDVEAGLGEKVIARLARYVLRSKVTMRMSDWVVRAYRGTGAVSEAGPGAGRAVPYRGGDDAIDVIAPAPELPAAGEPVGAEVIDAVRVDSEWPATGTDILEGDIPATTGVLAEAVSFTKGCYPGQELVERMDSRGSSAPVVLRVLSSGETADGCTVTSRGATKSIARVPRGVSAGRPLGGH